MCGGSGQSQPSFGNECLGQEGTTVWDHGCLGPNLLRFAGEDFLGGTPLELVDVNVIGKERDHKRMMIG